MTKIVILGSTRHSPYEILAPDPLNPSYTVENHEDYNTEEEYERAKKLFYPAIEQADLILVYAPDGIGEHTRRDIDHAILAQKTIYVITKFIVYKIEAERYTR